MMMYQFRNCTCKIHWNQFLLMRYVAHLHWYICLYGNCFGKSYKSNEVYLTYTHNQQKIICAINEKIKEGDLLCFVVCMYRSRINALWYKLNLFVGCQSRLLHVQQCRRCEDGEIDGGWAWEPLSTG